jgi:serine protease Do
MRIQAWHFDPVSFYGAAAKVCVGILVSVCAWSSACAAAAPTAGNTVLSTQETMDALTRASQAVVGVQVEAAEGARSIETLGPRRRGSGVVIGADGLVLTIGYLMLEAQTIQLITQDKKTIPARAVAYDLATGFGLIMPLVPLRGITPVAMGSFGDAKPGDAMMAGIGAQPGRDADVSMTQLISKRAFSGYWEYHIDSALFTSPPVENHSGVPLFNQRGELLGIGSLFMQDAMGSATANTSRLPGNMFVPIDLLKPIISEMTQTGSSKPSKRPWLGLTSSEQAGRVQIIRVNKESPAQEAGLQPGDVVLAIDDAKVATLEAFYKKLWDRATPDAQVKLTVLQGAEIKTIVLKPVDRMSTLRKSTGI